MKTIAQTKQKDFTPTGIKIDGAYENDRNADCADVLKDIIREAYGVNDVIIAHHLVYVTVEKRNGFDFQVVEEIPSTDTLIFDHEVARKLWGPDFKSVLIKLALEPVETRDILLSELYYGRKNKPVLS